MKALSSLLFYLFLQSVKRKHTGADWISQQDEVLCKHAES